MVLPGELFAFYRWGGTIDSILPPLTDRPVAVRNIVPLRRPPRHRRLLGRRRGRRAGPAGARPAPPLLRLLGAGAVVANADGDIRRSGQPPPARSARVLAEQGLGRPDRRYGPTRRLLQPVGDIGPAVALPEVRRYDVRVPEAHRARRARRRSHGRRRVGGRARRAGGVRGASRARRDRLRGRPERGAAASRRSGGLGGRRQRLQSPPGLRLLPPGAERWLDAGRRREALRGRRDAQPVRRPRDRRPDGGGLPRRALDPRAVLSRRRAVPRAPAVCRVRRRPADRVAGGPPPRARPPPPRRRVRSPPRRAVRRRAARERPLRGGARDRGRRADVPGPLRAGTGFGWTCAARARCGCASPRSTSLPGSSRRARAAWPRCGSRACGSARRCARRCSPSARSRAATCATARSPTCSSAPRATPPTGGAGSRARRRLCSPSTAATGRPASSASFARPRPARSRPTPGCRHRPTPTTTRSTRSPGPGARRACIPRAASRGSRAGGPRARSTATGARPGSASGWSAPRRGSPGRRRGRCASAACAWRPRPRSCAFRRGCASSPRAATAGRCASGPGAS